MISRGDHKNPNELVRERVEQGYEMDLDQTVQRNSNKENGKNYGNPMLVFNLKFGRFSNFGTKVSIETTSIGK
ncbi:hypothetical protein ACH5RR_002771 [Cinchona calisaya]|uniref:Uncharacterized protein n=1 Tax=Cinchona calisaya TaxID=153742 RepID=A0ABD3ASX2_9GENT